MSSELADELPRLARCGGGDGARIEDAEISQVTLGDNLMSAGRKSARHGLDLTDVEPAADRIESDSQSESA